MLAEIETLREKFFCMFLFVFGDLIGFTLVVGCLFFTTVSSEKFLCLNRESQSIFKTMEMCVNLLIIYLFCRIFRKDKLSKKRDVAKAEGIER